jgi:hypothetical protein
MQRTRKVSIAVLAALAATPAFAGHYDGPDTGVKRPGQQPGKSNVCDQYQNDTNAKRFAACEFGRDEATSMAQRYGSEMGRLHGYLRGYAWGLNRATQANENDSAYQQAGASQVDSLDSYLQNGVSSGQAAGSNDGTAVGRQDAIARFTSVLDKGVDPDSTVTVPATSYAGDDGAYEKYVGQVPSPQQVLSSGQVNAPALSVYQGWDNQWMGDRHDMKPGDLWNDHGGYDFDNKNVFDGGAALNTWLQKQGGGERQRYDGLNTGAPVDPTTKQPIDLQAVFKDAFQKSYGDTAQYAYSQSFYEAIDLGESEGDGVGSQVGRVIAQDIGLEQAFNQKFRATEIGAYQATFASAYSSSFQATFQDYATNPKLSISFDKIAGDPDTGVIQPGQSIDAFFTVQNVGGVASPLTATVSGNVVNPQTQSFQVGRLQTVHLTAANVAQIDPSLQNGATASVTISVNGITASLNDEIQNMIQLASMTPAISATDGTGQIQFTVQNIATVRTPGTVSATLSLNGQAVTTSQLGFLDPGASTGAVLSFSGVDPLSFINGPETATVTVTMNGVTMESQGTALSAGQADLVKYFNQLANGRGFVPASVNRDDRLADVQKQLVAADDAETKAHRSGEDIWRTQPATTVVGMCVAEFKASAQTDASKAAWTRLAQAFWSEQTNLRKFIVNMPKRAHYDALVKQLTSAKLK